MMRKYKTSGRGIIGGSNQEMGFYGSGIIGGSMPRRSRIGRGIIGGCNQEMGFYGSGVIGGCCQMCGGALPLLNRIRGGAPKKGQKQPKKTMDALKEYNRRRKFESQFKKIWNNTYEDKEHIYNDINSFLERREGSKKKAEKTIKEMLKQPEFEGLIYVPPYIKGSKAKPKDENEIIIENIQNMQPGELNEIMENLAPEEKEQVIDAIQENMMQEIQENTMREQLPRDILDPIYKELPVIDRLNKEYTKTLKPYIVNKLLKYKNELPYKPICESICSYTKSNLNKIKKADLIKIIQKEGYK
jgi:hypothetical protein